MPSDKEDRIREIIMIEVGRMFAKYARRAYEECEESSKITKTCSQEQLCIKAKVVAACWQKTTR